MAYDVQVRKTLNQRGIDNNRIGYNVNTGTVTVDGKDFLRPQKNINGTTFTDQGSFDKAYSSFFQQNQTPQQVTPTQQQPMTSQNIIGEVYNMLKNPTPYDVYSSPEYAAAAQAQQRATQQGVRTAQEALGASGFARSTNLAERAQRIQNQANEYLLTQIVPQLIAQNEARRQQQIGNLYNLISPLMRGEEFGKTFALQEGQLTGSYLPSGARDAIQTILQAKQENRYGGNQEAAQRADQARAYLASVGIDPSLFGADVTYEQALQNISRAGQQTLAKQGQEFSQGIQMAQLTGFLPDGTPTNAYQQQQLANAWKEADAFGYVTPALSQLTGIPVGTETLQAKQIAIAQQNANTSAARLNMPSATEERNAAMSEAISNIDQMTPEARKKFFQEQRAALINEFGLSGYNQLYNMYFDQYGVPKENPSKPTSYAPSNVSGLIQSTATKYGVNPSLAYAVASAESGYDQNAKSPAGAIGIFQLMPGTASDLGVNPNDLAQNIEGGIKYLAQQLRAFGGDIQKALAAYNWGPGNVQNAVKKYGSNWLAHAPSETRNYVAEIMSMIS